MTLRGASEIAVSILAVCVTAAAGGLEWALVCSIAVAALWWRGFRFGTLVSVLAVSLLWLALYRFTADRRLFFPYTMQLAVQLGFLLRGRVAHPAIIGGGGLMAVFVLIRVVQAATAAVLFVEVLVCVAILLLSLRTRNADFRTVASAVASLLAYVSLAL